MTSAIPDAPLTMWSAIKRTLARKCPACGTGKLFKGYLKQVDSCENCSENLGAIRADDGPAWLTILITGHILAPVLVLATGKSPLPLWLLAICLMSLGMAMCLTILPYAKAMFIGILWKSRAAEITPAEIATQRELREN
ncbi:MAG: hypothetical protein CME88_02410 [Hirschia sp.]|nr:hypothetical protein [Hirschia sp.]MBF17216.1 hypothetical protein [Hirschia sp.]